MICYPVLFRRNGCWETYAIPMDRRFAKALRNLLIAKNGLGPGDVKVKRGIEFR